MKNVLDKLSWNNSLAIQQEGIEEAKTKENIYQFIQPVNKKYNKNVWENCSLILSGKTNEELKVFLIPLLEWIQDLNWPGAMNIWNRLKEFEKENLKQVILYSLMKATINKDSIWQENLITLLKEIDLYEDLYQEIKSIGEIFIKDSNDE